jgi:amino acid adenylation domain-containing protein
MTAEVIDEAPASFVQERMFTEEQIYDTCTIYTVGSGLRLAGTLDPERLRAAMSAVIRRHEILRTSFRLRADELVQVIHPSAEPDLTVHDLRQAPAERRVRAAEALIRRAQDRAFALGRPPLWRALLFVLADDESWLVFTLHHTVIDGWSLTRLWRDVRDAYESPQPGPGDAAPSPRYAEYARWERGRDDDALRRSLAYWQERLAEPASPLNLPFDRLRGPNRVYRGAMHRFAVPPELVRALRAECTRRRATPFVVLLAAYVALLRRYCDQADLRIGVPLANRMRPETRELIGPLINFLPLCLTVDDEMTFDALASQARLATLGALEHQEVPLNLVTRQLVGPATQPLYQAVFSVQPPPEPTTRFSGVPAAPLDLPSSGSARADVDMMLVDQGDVIQGVLQYSTEVFESSTIERMAANFLRLLAGALERPGQRIHELPLLTAEEAATVGQTFPRHGPAEPGVLHHLVDRAAAERPAAPAVTGRDTTFTYAELVALANQVAHVLREYGAGPERLVAVCAPRGVYTPVLMLAALKSGAGYLVLDPDHPAERNDWTMSDAAPVLLVTGDDPPGFAPATPSVPLAALLSAAGKQPDDPPPVAVDPAHVAYVVYTSGSTGRPKGVAVPHAGITNLIRAGQPVAARPDDVTVVHAAMTFDGSTLETWMALANGAELVVAPPGRLSIEDYRGLARQVSYMQFTPGLFNVLADEARAGLAAIPRVLLGGDRVEPGPVAAARGGPGTRTLTSYGPTECSVIATTGDALSRTGTGRVPIGRPVAGVETYILDRRLRPVPIGVAGELYIGGVGLARGYLGRPGLTAERFVPHPFADRPGRRLYATGDCVRWLPDGSIDFLGRFDDQVKIRGFRVEPGEIATVLSGHPLVSSAVVVVRTQDGTGPALVGYVVLAPARPAGDGAGLGAADEAELLAYCRARLPDYMVPRHLVAIDAVPLTGNGKVDRRALPEPRHRVEEPSAEEIRKPAESILAEIWTEVLGVPAVGLDEDFFDAGGDSLAVLRVVAAASQRGLNLTAQDLYRLGTVRACAAGVEAGGSTVSG